MRRAVVVAVVLALAGCAHSAAEGPSYKGHVRGLTFDRTSVTGPYTSFSRSDDGSRWLARWKCGGNAMCFREVEVSDEGIATDGLWAGIEMTPRAAMLHTADYDLVLRRADGGPVPREMLVPLWLAIDFPTVSGRPGSPGPSGECLPVDGLGVVQVMHLPTGLPWQVEVSEGCRFHFLNPVSAP